VAILWTHHAVVALEKRGLAADDVLAILLDPEWGATDSKDATLSRAFGKTASDDYWVRVVFRQMNKDDILVITVHLDRDTVPPV
jgi:hypothetical protein